MAGPQVNGILVAGIGSVLMGDEGVGVFVLRRLLAERGGIGPIGPIRPILPSGIDFVELGTGGIALVHQLAGRRKAVIIDCAKMGEEPGTIRRFTPEEIRSRKVVTGGSLHEGDVLGIIDLAKSLGQAPPEIVIFGIEPERIDPGAGLSEPLRMRIGEYVRAVAAELSDAGP
jgi:hydrogenase maturation protease